MPSPSFHHSSLSPWLGHLMVSRQETARQLLTPGEVMQLPPDDEIVMVSGHPPVRARKLRFYADANFKSRLSPAPQLASDGYRDRPATRADDWSGRLDASTVETAERVAVAMLDADEGGLRRQPELEVEAPSVVMDDDEPVARRGLALLDDDLDDAEAGTALATTRQFGRTARLAALDPDDGIAL